jgi:CarD family transcriptional regulator
MAPSHLSGDSVQIFLVNFSQFAYNTFLKKYVKIKKEMVRKFLRGSSEQLDGIWIEKKLNGFILGGGKEDMEWKVGSTLLYGEYGICQVEDIRKEDFNGQEREYYILRPAGDKKAAIFVPIDSNRLKKYGKEIATSNEILKLIEKMPDECIEWIEDRKARNEKYRTIWESGDRQELIRIIKMIYCRKQELLAVGKRLNSTDETALEKSEKMLYDEFALVLDLKPEEVIPFIHHQIQDVQS